MNMNLIEKENMIESQKIGKYKLASAAAGGLAN